MNGYSKYLAGAALLASSALAGCASNQVSGALNAMQANHVDGCISVTSNVAGYAGAASGCVAGASNGAHVTADGGKVDMARGSEATAAAK